MPEDPYSLERLQDTTGARQEAIDRLMNPDAPTPNVVGVGDGIKYRGGEPTGEQAITVFVSVKVDEASLQPGERIPAEIQGFRTDVVEVGQIAPQSLTSRMRPAWGGLSVGHVSGGAGTMGAIVYERRGRTPRPPAVERGFHFPYYILSNNHVIANSNAGSFGDLILQPAPLDGGTAPADVIARLTRFVSLEFSPPTPLNLHDNWTDSAIAEVDLDLADRRQYFGNIPRAWLNLTWNHDNLPIGLVVKKTGRTTDFSTGRVTNVNTTLDVGPYPGNRTARFKGQIVFTGMSDFGDSGSLITTLDDVAIGLLFAGSAASNVTVAGSINAVWGFLRVEIADEVLFSL